MLHNFYVSGKCADLEIVPSAECKALLQTFGLRFMPTTFGAKVFSKVNTIAGVHFIKNPIPEATKFTFLLKLKNRLFENFTSLDLNKPKTNRYYFNNLVNNVSAVGFPLLVSDTVSKVVSNTDHLPFAINSFSFAHNSVEAEQSSELRFNDSGETFTQTLENHNNTFNFTYDLLKTLGGRAAFSIEGVDQSTMYVTSAADATNVFGIVDIFYKASLPADYNFQLPDNSVVSRFYKIQFANRSTRWRYVITKRFNQSVTGVTVAKSNGAPIAFSALPGAPAGMFIMTSNTDLPLKEDPVTGIKLTDQLNKPIIANLPNPALSMVTQEGANIFSDILITI